MTQGRFPKDDTPPVRILVVDDEAANVTALTTTLSARGYEVAGFAAAAEALEAQRTPSVERLNPVHFFGGGSTVRRTAARDS